MKRTTITMPDELSRRVDEASAKRRTSVSQLVREAIERHLDPEPVNGPRFGFTGLVNKGGYPESDEVEEYLARHYMDDILKRWGR